MFLREASLPLHVEHKVTTAHKLYDEEESGRSLEAGMQTHQEGMVGGGLKHVFLSLNPVNVLKENNSYVQGKTYFIFMYMYEQVLLCVTDPKARRCTSSSVTSVFLMTFMA